MTTTTDANSPSRHPDGLPGGGVAEHGPVRGHAPCPLAGEWPFAVEAARLARRSAGSPPGCRPSADETPRSTPTGCSTGSSTSPPCPAARRSIRSVPHRRSYLRATRPRPAGRSGGGVYCHDLDAFRSLLDPSRTPAAVVPCPRPPHPVRDAKSRDRLSQHGCGRRADQPGRIGAPDRLVLAPYGIASEFTADSPRPPIPLPWLAELGGQPWVLHVGTCIPLDVLLDVCARSGKRSPTSGWSRSAASGRLCSRTGSTDSAWPARSPMWAGWPGRNWPRSTAEPRSCSCRARRRGSGCR